MVVCRGGAARAQRGSSEGVDGAAQRGSSALEWLWRGAATATAQSKGREKREEERRKTVSANSDFDYDFSHDFPFKHEKFSIRKLFQIPNPTTLILGTFSFEAPFES